MHPERDPEELKAIGNRLKFSRLALGVSQKSLYERLGVAANTWHQWEAGKRTPDPLVMTKLHDLFGISLDWIYAGNPQNLPDSIAGKVQKVAS